MTTNETNLTAIENVHGWSVEDAEGGRWWPDEEAQAEIEAADDPAARAVEICLEDPMRGEWRD